MSTTAPSNIRCVQNSTGVSVPSGVLNSQGLYGPWFTILANTSKSINSASLSVCTISTMPASSNSAPNERDLVANEAAFASSIKFTISIT